MNEAYQRMAELIEEGIRNRIAGGLTGILAATPGGGPVQRPETAVVAQEPQGSSWLDQWREKYGKHLKAHGGKVPADRYVSMRKGGDPNYRSNIDLRGWPGEERFPNPRTGVMRLAQPKSDPVEPFPRSPTNPSHGSFQRHPPRRNR